MRVPVELKRAATLLNHGPTTLIASAHGQRRDVMAAAWTMPLDFDPPKLAVVIAGDTFTRELVAASRELVVSLPTVAMAGVTWEVGSTSGRDLDKFTTYSLGTSPASTVAAPLIDGCAAWLECRVIDEPHLADAYDLFLCEVLAAWADDRCWNGRAWQFAEPGLRTIHHVARGNFFATGELL
jgi:flavin reductase (DIM6/NTAB) family NADH-FMN oxidoreductase RutF